MTADPDFDVLDGKCFAPVAKASAGEVDEDTRFHYRQDADTIWADYTGGSIVRGYLVGTRDGDELDFRYVHLNRAGETAAGHCHSRIEIGPNGALRLLEVWSWESRDGAGTSVVQEVPCE